MQWIQIAPRTCSMQVPGGTLYSLTEGNSVAICFVPYMPQLPQLYPYPQTAYPSPSYMPVTNPPYTPVTN